MTNLGGQEIVPMGTRTELFVTLFFFFAKRKDKTIPSKLYKLFQNKIAVLKGSIRNGTHQNNVM